MPLQGHLKVQLVPAVTEKGTHDSAGTLREYRVCFAVQKMSQKETTRVITSSSDKLHYAEGEEMNEELLKGSFQLLISQLKPGALFSLQILRITISVGERLLQEAKSGIPFYHGLHWGISALKSPFTRQSQRCLPARGLNLQPKSSSWSYRMELDALLG